MSRLLQPSSGSPENGLKSLTKLPILTVELVIDFLKPAKSYR